MRPRVRARAAALGRVLLGVALSACHREGRRLREAAVANLYPLAPQSVQQPGPAVQGTPFHVAARSPELGALYATNAWAISEGKRLYSWFNCSGCHARGGGGMGPALMDDRWLYGRQPQDIFASIAGGRPKGMPAFGSRVPEAQIWLLVAFVQSLGGGLPRVVLSPRADQLSGHMDSPEQLDRPKRPASGEP